VVMRGASASFFSSEKAEPEYAAGWLIELRTSSSFMQEYLVRLDPCFSIVRVASSTSVNCKTVLCFKMIKCAVCLAVEMKTFAICFFVCSISSLATSEIAFFVALQKLSQTISISLASIL